MAFARRNRSAHSSGDAHGELNITPLLDVFVALIPFLIMSVVLSRVTVLDVGIAAPGGVASAAENIREREIEMRVFPGRAEILVDAKQVASVKRGADDKVWTEEVHNRLVEIKKQKLDDLKIYVVPQERVNLNTVMALMDSARELKTKDGDIYRKEKDGRETKLRYLFPQIILRGVY